MAKGDYLTKKDYKEVARGFSFLISMFLFPLVFILKDKRKKKKYNFIIKRNIRQTSYSNQKFTPSQKVTNIKTPNLQLEKYFEIKNKEIKYLLEKINLQHDNQNKNERWFIDYEPLYFKNKKSTIGKINSDYEAKLYVDKNYEFSLNVTNARSKFPKYFVKFENNYKRYGCISFYGITKSWLQDYLFYSKNAGNFILKKIYFVSAFAFSKDTNTFSKINFNTDCILNSNQINDIYIIVKSKITKKPNLIYDNIWFNFLDIYKNNKLIKRFDISSSTIQIKNNIVEIKEENGNIIKFDIFFQQKNTN